MVVHFAGFARFQDDADAGTFSLLDQVLMNSARCEQSADGDALCRNGAVGENHERIAFVHRGFGLGSDAVQRRDHA